MSIFKHHNAAAFDPSQSAGKMNENDTPMAFLKILIAWIAATVSTVSEKLIALDLAHWVQIVALIFTLLQTFFLVRDKWWRDRKQRRSKRRAQNDRSSFDKTRA